MREIIYLFFFIHMRKQFNLHRMNNFYVLSGEIMNIMYDKHSYKAELHDTSYMIYLAAH